MCDPTCNKTFSLGNDLLSRTFRVGDGRFATTEVRDRRSGHQLAMDSREFEILLTDGARLTGADFRYCGHEFSKADTGEKLLKVDLDCEREGIHVQILYALGADDFYVRKRIAVRGNVAQGRFIDRLDVESFKPPAPVDAVAAFQPVFIADRFFVGLEFPAGINEFAQGVVRTSHFPGIALGREPFESKTAVLGAAGAGGAFRSFLSYVERVRRRTPPCVYWNSGGELQIYDPVQLRKQSMNFTQVLRGAIARLQTELTVKRGVPVHMYTLEPAWHDPETLYEVDERRFPGGLKPVSEQLHATGSELGLWLSPSTPISPALLRRSTVERNGYKLAMNPEHPGEYPCLSYPPYLRDIKEVMCRHAKDLSVAYYKMDFSFFDCAGEGHGHLPNKRHGREANVNAMIEIMEAIMRVQPHIRLVPTSGMWLSPWWLLYASVVWPHGMDDFCYDPGPVSTNPRDWELTLRDQELHRLLRAERGRFPFSGVMALMMAGGPRYNIAGPNESRESYIRTQVYNMARQVKCPERCIDGPPSSLPEDWDATAAAITWALDRYDRIPDGEMILGQPTRGEAYGFRNMDSLGGTVTLRNPSMAHQKAAIPVDVLDDGTEFVVEITYPYRQCLAIGRRNEIASKLLVELTSHAVIVVEVHPRPALARPLLLGCRYALGQREPGEVHFDVLSEAGKEVRFQVISPLPLRGILLDSARVRPDSGPIALPAKGAKERLEVFALPRRGGDDPASLAKSPGAALRLDIPDSQEATLRILADDERPHPLECTVNMGGWFGCGLPHKVCRGKGWTAYDLELNPRDMNVIQWRFPPDHAPRTAKMWLLRQWELQRTRVTLLYDRTLKMEMDRELPTPFAGRVHDALCVSDLNLEPSRQRLPWTDEYAQTKDGEA